MRIPINPGLHTQYTRFRRRSGSVVATAAVYILLTAFVFVYLYPFLFMLINSVKNQADLLDINKQWVLSSFQIANYQKALNLLNYLPTLGNTLLLVVLATAGHVLSSSYIAYGLARFKVIGSRLIFVLIILTILIPSQILIMPLTVQYSRLGWMYTQLPLIVPSFFGFGLRGGLFVYICLQYFKGLPRSFEESAKIEGCSSVGIFFRIMMPMARTTLAVVATLSLIWHWNDAFEPSVYLVKGPKILTQVLSESPTWFYMGQTASGQSINVVQLAMCVLALLPLLVLFFMMQRRFVEGMELSGLAN